MTTQQEFLREAATTLGLSIPELANRMGAPIETLVPWILPKNSRDSREMPVIAWTLIREILAHERLKSKHHHSKR